MGQMVMMDALKQYRGKRVFITGHTGFKGSWLTFLMINLGAEVTGFALPPDSNESHFCKLDLTKKIKRHIEGDIRDKESLISAMDGAKPEYVFHLAAQALVKESYLDPLETFSTNMLGSVHLLEAVRLTESVKSLVYITSDKCYENNEWIWGYRENDKLGGHDPYSASKAGAEIIFSAYWRSFFKNRANFGAATARAGNVIGGGDWAADRIIPDCIRAIKKEVAIELRNPFATRPWQHVLEPLCGYLLLGANLYANPEKYSGEWNFGPPSSQCKTVGEVAQSVVDIFGRGEIATNFTSAKILHEAQLLQLNCDKAHQLLGWHSRWDVSQTLSATVGWYKDVLEGANVSAVTLSQIKEFFPELSDI
jgi:CDP-glucose 4,6-dehydratase